MQPGARTHPSDPRRTVNHRGVGHPVAAMEQHSATMTMSDTPPTWTPSFLTDVSDAALSDSEGDRRLTTALMAEVEAHNLSDWLQLATTPPKGSKTASTKAGRELCAVACVCLERGDPLPGAMPAYLAHALRQGAEGRSVDQALGLKRGAARRKTANPIDVARREQMIYVWIFGKCFREGCSEADAKAAACTQFNLDLQRIEQIWRRDKPSAEAMDAMREWQQAMTAVTNREPLEHGSPAHHAWIRDVLEQSKLLLRR